MKKYKVYKNGTYLESYNLRWEAEKAIQEHKNNERRNAIQSLTYWPCSCYEIRR